MGDNLFSASLQLEKAALTNSKLALQQGQDVAQHPAQVPEAELEATGLGHAMTLAQPFDIGPQHGQAHTRQVPPAVHHEQVEQEALGNVDGQVVVEQAFLRC